MNNLDTKTCKIAVNPSSLVRLTKVGLTLDPYLASNAALDDSSLGGRAMTSTQPRIPSTSSDAVLKYCEIGPASRSAQNSAHKDINIVVSTGEFRCRGIVEASVVCHWRLKFNQCVLRHRLNGRISCDECGTVIFS